MHQHQRKKTFKNKMRFLKLSLVLKGQTLQKGKKRQRNI